MDDMRQKVSPTHETTVKLSLAPTHCGLEWGKGKIICGLFDMFSFVAVGLNTLHDYTWKAPVCISTWCAEGDS